MARNAEGRAQGQAELGERFQSHSLGRRKGGRDGRSTPSPIGCSADWSGARVLISGSSHLAYCASLVSTSGIRSFTGSTSALTAVVSIVQLCTTLLW